ncbi:hypothetical protein SCP_1602720 [Sparassis crispa]|uniref:Uncharacterized protein n=1 Tax=Sparassis crispa TaxID=139825 RepID=A0A401H5E8_9APHY|nr:hypothetical protein SCP_1602720 [Sparassis crispa]GBE89609.1 hypothetical protein SCP_1602720 [Sparassis crispa]
MTSIPAYPQKAHHGIYICAPAEGHTLAFIPAYVQKAIMAPMLSQCRLYTDRHVGLLQLLAFLYFPSFPPSFGLSSSTLFLSPFLSTLPFSPFFLPVFIIRIARLR